MNKYKKRVIRTLSPILSIVLLVHIFNYGNISPRVNAAASQNAASGNSICAESAIANFSTDFYEYNINNYKGNRVNTRAINQSAIQQAAATGKKMNLYFGVSSRNIDYHLSNDGAYNKYYDNMKDNGTTICGLVYPGIVKDTLSDDGQLQFSNQYAQGDLFFRKS